MCVGGGWGVALGDGAWPRAGAGREGVKFNSGFILGVALIGFARGCDVECERKGRTKGDCEEFGLSHRLAQLSFTWGLSFHLGWGWG